MKLASFDLEIAKEIPNDTKDFFSLAPLGITCAAVAYSDTRKVDYWTGMPKMTKDECSAMVDEFIALIDNGYIFVTWNGLSFDFRVLAQESGRYEECKKIAMNHIDMMVIVTFTKGWYVGLDSVLAGAGLKGKKKEVKLNNGEICVMSGAKAPKMWKDGEHKAVLSYLRDDVIQPLLLAEHIMNTKKIQWTSSSGKRHVLDVDGLISVNKCFEIPEPDVSWMTNPPKREQFINWGE